MESAGIPHGQVRVELNPDRQGHRWYLVSLGRARYVKRVNLSDTEARLMIAELAPLLGLEVKAPAAAP
jgi:hypothetical protein